MGVRWRMFAAMALVAAGVGGVASAPSAGADAAVAHGGAGATVASAGPPGCAQAAAASAAAPGCADASVRFAADYRHVVGSAEYVASGQAEAGSRYRWIVSDAAGQEQEVSELFGVGFDAGLTGHGGEEPVASDAVETRPARWGSAIVVGDPGILSYRREGNLDLAQGTIELWVTMLEDGGADVYRSRTHVLFQYRVPNGEYIQVAQAGESGILYAGGRSAGAWQSAYGALASTRGWRAGQWHHIAYTFSGRGNFMRLYVDGVLTADSNEKRYLPPSDAGAAFSVGGSLAGKPAHYAVDAVRILGRPASQEEISAWSRRFRVPEPHEEWLNTGELDAGDTVRFEYVPASGGQSGPACLSDPLEYPGIPVTDPRPPSTLLPAGTTEFTLTVTSAVPTACRYALRQPRVFSDMLPFDTGAGGQLHTTAVRGLDPDPSVVNRVYVRCASHPDFLLALRYRVLSSTDPSFPRTGNLWGSWHMRAQGMKYASRIDLWLGAAFTPDEIRQLRRLNPDTRVLTSINAVENRGLPDDYYLKDVNGRRIEVWPGSFRLNLTKPHVAEHQARYAAQRILDSDLQYDGCFFDNFMTTQSWLRRDIYGNEVQIDANEDGVPDDPAEFDAAWKAGLFHEMREFRRLMPYAIVSGHSMNVTEPGIAELFNGISIGFWTADVIEGKRGFPDLLDRYLAWLQHARQPTATMIESSPPDQIAYGYDYDPRSNIPPSTLEFARTYYPYVRFGLAFTLLGNGYFAHEFGDTWHGNDWWYDELDYDLGRPLGPAERVEVGPGPGPNILTNGSFEDEIAPAWRLWANRATGCAASVTRDTADAAVGRASARVDITSTSGTDWHVSLAQFDRSLTGGQVYEMSLWAKADAPRLVRLSAQKGSPDWRGYGLSRVVEIDTEWRQYSVSFTATETTDESRIQVFVGQRTGTVWLDDLRLNTRGPDIYRRDFDHGAVILNGSRDVQEIDVGPGYARLSGRQAPRFERILDDADSGFSITGRYAVVTHDSGEWQAAGPFYHDWGPSCHELLDGSAEGRWTLPIDASDVYTVTAWWPAAPEADGWSANAQYSVVADGQVVATATLDQRSGGDEWHTIAQVPLAPADAPYVLLRCGGGAPCVADALHVTSAARYNDGAPARRVTLQPMDGIVLRRREAVRLEIYLPLASNRRSMSWAGSGMGVSAGDGSKPAGSAL